MNSEPPNPSFQRVVLGALTDRGDAQAEIVTQREDGEQQTRVLHVPAGLPGEEVTIGVQEFANIPPRRHRRRWKPRPPRVWIEQVHTSSELRVEPRCPVFGECGGCQLQHMSYAAQLVWKRAQVGQWLREVGGLDD